MKNIFQGNSEHPQHVSVGAVVLNDKNEVCCHHFKADELKEGYWVEQGLDDFYLLMRETLEPGEALEGSLARGLMEEFGVEAELIDYIGSLQGFFKHRGVSIEKTTLYFLTKLKNQDLSKRNSSGIDGRTSLEWQTPDFLIPKMKEQVQKYGRTDVDESKILEIVKARYLK